MSKADIGLIGLAVMGQNLVLNMTDHGYTVCVFNRTLAVVENFIKCEAKNRNIIGANSLLEFIENLNSPRIIMLLVKAGQAVDDLIRKLIPFLQKNDIIIDGGNSEYIDSNRRCKELAEKNILFVGSGVSGGEEGARNGPSLMPGGNIEAWKHIQQIFQDIAAKAENNQPCCDWVGLEGAGHFVKMVHNGIEYGDMQLICEAYHLMRDFLEMENEEISTTFEQWNKSELESFLIEITSLITKFKGQDGQYLLNDIYDSAGQKGTGKWTAINALDLGVPVTLIAESVFARNLSALKSIRVEASKRFPSNNFNNFTGNKQEFLNDLKLALYASKIISYTQGFMMMKTASDQYKWQLNLGKIALMWRGGCIIRSRFLQNIKEAYEKNNNLFVLLFDEFFQNEILKCQTSWRKVVSAAVMQGLPTPAFSSALAFYDGLRSEKLPANLLQAQRDLFGAHQYQLLSNPDQFHHTNWTGNGGSAAASTYQR